MDSLPDLNFIEHSKPLTPSEQALLDQFKREYRDQLSHIITNLKQSYLEANHDIRPSFESTFKKSIDSLNRLLEGFLSKSLIGKRTKRELDGLQDIIASAEKLAFLIRYFNWENDENYTKTMSSKASKAHSYIYAFNVYFQTWIKSIIQHIEPDPRVLLKFLNHLNVYDSNDVPTDLLGLRIPIKRKRALHELSRVILLDYYYLERAYRSLQDLLVNESYEHVQGKMKEIYKRIDEQGKSSDDSTMITTVEDKQNNPENKVFNDLEKELQRIASLKDDVEILEYFYKNKKRIDGSISEVEALIQARKEESRTQNSGLFSYENLDNIVDRKESTMLLEKVDEILSAEVKQYAIGGKTLKAYWQEVNQEIRQEVVKMVSLDKFLLQASYLSIYFEERFVVFHSGRGQFIHENFAKLIEEFCYNANKEYKNMPAPSNTQGLLPLYYCYIAENYQDFYLVEYNPNLPILKVYLTAAPMLATLHKHLAKLDITKIAKKSFYITRLNFYDTEVGIELRNLFFDPKNKKSEDSDEEDEDSVPKHFKYFIFITIFLLHNSAFDMNTPEIFFNAQDLITFYNYLAEYQGVSLKNQEESQPIPSTFEFYYPFVNMRQPREQYLTFNKKDPSRDTGLVAVRNLCAQNKNLLHFGELLSEEKFYSESFFNNEVIKYLKRNETKSSFNFDSEAYLLEYLKRVPTVHQAPPHGTDYTVTVISRMQTQSMLEIFLAGDRNAAALRGLEDSSKASKVYLLFSGTPECFGLLMVVYERWKDRCIVYSWATKESHEEVLHDFVEYIRGVVKADNEAHAEESKEDKETHYVVCKSTDEIVVQYYHNHHFPYTFLFEQEGVKNKDTLEIGLEDLVEPFKSFLSINISENNLDVFKAYSRILEEKMFKYWEIVNIGVLWKFSEVKYTLQTLAEKLQEEQVDNVLMAFSFVGAVGSKVYYLYLQEMPAEESKDEERKDSQSQEVTYLIDVFSLAYNQDIDDRELLTLISYCCKTISKPRFVFNAAYRINPRNNILLYTQVEITLTTLAYLVHFCHLSMERAFQKISRSIVGHYEILETLMSEAGASNQTESNEKQNHEKVEPAEGTQPLVMDLTPLSPEKEVQKQKVRFKVFQSFFEDILKEVHFKRKLETLIPDLLKNAELESTEGSENMDIASFLNILNCEIMSPMTYFFIINETFTKRVLTNENNLLTDKSVYSFLIKELGNTKVKYQEALGIKYQATCLYFITPLSLLHITRIPLVKYSIESHQITYYYLDGEGVPKLNENITAFIDTLSLKLVSSSAQAIKAMSAKELKVSACEVIFPKDLQEVLDKQYPTITRALIRLSSWSEAVKDDKLLLNTEKLNEFLCEYADNLLFPAVENSKVKANYKYLSNLFLQKDSPLTKKTALLTFLNGTASIEQLGIIKDCIKSFRDDFNKIPDMENAFFCFNVSVKNSLKHYLLHLSGQKRDNLSLKVFTNILGDTDTVIDRMIQTYCMEDGEESGVRQLLIFKINIPNIIFTKYLEISSFLIAHAVCNDASELNEYCAQLALSPIHYFNELKAFEKKCEDLNLFDGPSPDEANV